MFFRFRLEDSFFLSIGLVLLWSFHFGTPLAEGSTQENYVKIVKLRSCRLWEEWAGTKEAKGLKAQRAAEAGAKVAMQCRGVRRNNAGRRRA